MIVDNIVKVVGWHKDIDYWLSTSSFKTNATRPLSRCYRRYITIWKSNLVQGVKHKIQEKSRNDKDHTMSNTEQNTSTTREQRT